MSGNLSAFQIMERLVSFPTVSSASNLDLVDWIEGYLADLGIRAHRMPKEGDPSKHAIFCSVGPDVEGGIVLSGHLDVVPVEGQAWSTDPWKVIEKEGKYYGRGTCDMKGFDALALHALQKAARSDLKRPLQVALSFDEETGCNGAPPLIEAMVDAVPKADIAIIGEPSMMRCVTSHKGSFGFEVHVHGFEVHSSLADQGVSAVMEGARLIEWANKMNAENSAAERSAVAEMFDPGWTSLHVGQISGGTAHNIMAKDCVFGLDIRMVPDENVAVWKERVLEKAREIEAGMQAIRLETSVEMKPFFDVPGLQPEKDGAAERLTRSITGDNGTHVVSYGTEAGHFQNGGYSAVICGPGDIAQAHQPDEFLTIEQFEAGEAFLEKVVQSLCE